jgi:hypothetical protein
MPKFRFSVNFMTVKLCKLKHLHIHDCKAVTKHCIKFHKCYNKISVLVKNIWLLSVPVSIQYLSLSVPLWISKHLYKSVSEWIFIRYTQTQLCWCLNFKIKTLLNKCSGKALPTYSLFFPLYTGTLLWWNG